MYFSNYVELDEKFFSAIEATKAYGEVDTPQYYFYSDEDGNVSIYDKEFDESFDVVDREFAEENNKLSGKDKAKIAGAGAVGAGAGYLGGGFGSALKPARELLKLYPELAEMPREQRSKLVSKYTTPNMASRIKRGSRLGLIVGGIGAGALAYKKLKNRNGR